ncbi:MFS transporter [Nonomuraea sediminis]|uniref:MFS transporter n=1 Tax=Nonomuraea sediminis TaxID=2835864 RepID=UPI001BDC0919|nr:MFS transporter [Nonomuraea sediminis]
MSHHRAIAAVFAVHGAVAGSLATRLPWIQEHLHLGPATLGLVLLCPSIGAFVGMPLASRLAYRLGGRAATRLLLALWCAVLAVPALAPAPAFLFPIFLTFGVLAGMCDVVINAHAVVLERRLGRPIISGLHGMWCVGSLAAGGLGALAAQAGIDARLHLGATSLGLLALGAWLGRGLLPDSGTRADQPAPRRFVLPSRAIAAIGVIGFCGTFAEGASANWAAVYVTKVTHAGPGVAAAAFTTFMLSMACARLAGDRILRLTGPVVAVRTGGILAAAGGVLVVAGRVPWLCVLGFALLGLGVAVIVPLVFAAAGNAGPSPGEGVAGVATITYLSGLIAPAVTGWVAGGLSYPAAFAMITGVAALLALLAPVLRPQPAARGEVRVGA